MSSHIVSFKNVVHCTHFPEVANMVQRIDNERYFVHFKQSPVGGHHASLVSCLSEELGLVWFGITPMDRDDSPYVLNSMGQNGFDCLRMHPVFEESSRYGPFTFELELNTVFQSYCHQMNLENVDDMFFYRVIQDQYKQERSDIVVVSAFQIPELNHFRQMNIPLRQRADNPAIWEWLCEDFYDYESCRINEYRLLEFAFIIPLQCRCFSFTVTNDPNDCRSQCLLKSNSHENAHICIPYNCKWGASRIMLAKKVVQLIKPYKHKCLTLQDIIKLNQANDTLLIKGACNNPPFAEEVREGLGIQDKFFADQIIKNMFITHL